MSDRDRSYASRLFDLCIGILLAAMALYGAVQVVKAVWVPISIGAFVVVSTFAIGWLIWVRAHRY